MDMYFLLDTYRTLYVPIFKKSFIAPALHSGHSHVLFPPPAPVRAGKQEPSHIPTLGGSESCLGHWDGEGSEATGVLSRKEQPD